MKLKVIKNTFYNFNRAKVTVFNNKVNLVFVLLIIDLMLRKI
jgi:hypothetical protein